MGDEVFIDDDGKTKMRIFIDGGMNLGGGDSHAVYNNESRNAGDPSHITDTYQLSQGDSPTLAAGLFLMITSSFPTPDPYTITNDLGNGQAITLQFSGGVVQDSTGLICEIKGLESNGGLSLIKISLNVSATGMTLVYTCAQGELTVTGGDMAVAHLYKTS